MPFYWIAKLIQHLLPKEPIKKLKNEKQKTIDEQRKKNQKMDEEPPVL